MGPANAIYHGGRRTPMGPGRRREERARPGTVFIGNKPTMAYVFQVVEELNSGPDPVTVKARGNAIGKAVDVVEVVRKRFLEGEVTLGTIEIGTERLVNHDGRSANVSSITIPLVRKASAAVPAAAAPAAVAPPPKPAPSRAPVPGAG
jgi:DNA-binding protein